MGLVSRDCQPLLPGGCNALFDDGNAILDSAWAGLSGFALGSVCESVERYVTVGTPVAPLVAANDRLSVNLASYTPTPQGAGFGLGAGSGSADQFQFDANWRVELWCHGWPTIAGQTEARQPTAGELHAVSGQLYAFGASVYQRLLDDRRSGALFDLATHVVLSAMLPLGPAGGLAGWGFNLTVRR